MASKAEVAVKVLIAASGTGGHLFPALHVARALREINSNCEILFVGSGRPLEEKIIRDAGFPLTTLPVQGVKNRGIKGILQFLFSLPKTISMTRNIFSQFKPQVVVGLGGYVTFFPIVYGRLTGVPTWIHEAELRPGLANYVLSFFTNKISVAFEKAQMPFASKVIFTGHPVRNGLLSVRNSQPISNAPRNILVMGGSQGAEGLDRGLPELSDLIKSQNLSIYHQCRKDNIERVEKEYKNRGIDAKVVSFIDDMAGAYTWADIIISRSGAGSIMELGIVNKPSILVPFPFSQGNHQVANSRVLVDTGKAILCEEGDGFSQRLEDALKYLLNIQNYNKMKTAPSEERNVDAAMRIAQACLSLTE